MNLEFVIQSYNTLDDEARKTFMKAYWPLWAIYRIKRKKFYYKVATITAGDIILLISAPFIRSISNGNLTKLLLIFSGTIIIFYLIGWLIGAIKYRGYYSLSSWKHSFLHVYAHTEASPLLDVFHFIQACQPELIKNTDREIKRTILNLINSRPNPFQTA